MNTFPEFTRLLNQQLLAQERSATWLARRLQLHPGTVNRWLNQELRPATPELVARIADLLCIHTTAERQRFLLAAGYGYVDSHAAQLLPLPTIAPKHNLPPQPTAFIGRQQELSQLLAELAQPDVRLLTIVGFGGIGKTRLALALADRLLGAFADGVWFVSLTGVDAATGQHQINPLVLSLAHVLAVTFLGQEDPEEQLLRYLQDKAMLLVVDNVEHLLPLCDFFSRLVRRAQQIKLIVTSRERLRLQEEWLFPLGALAMPALKEAPTTEAAPDLTTYDAIRLFEQQARRVQPTFALSSVIAQVCHICHLVEGIPLGIELAAAWLHEMPLAMIASEIESNHDFLTSSLRNQPERHRSFRTVFEYSWQLLLPEEQDGLMRLAVFRGGFRRAEAEAVTAATLPTLTTLVNKSLLHLNDEGRYTIHERIRQYAAEKLHQVAGRAAIWQARHTRVYLQFVRTCGQHLHDEAQMAALVAITAELANVSIAWEYALEQGYVDEISATQEIMFFFYLLKDRLLEGKEHTAKILTRLRLLNSQRAESDAALKKLKTDLGQALSFHAYFQMTTGFMAVAQPIFAESLAILRPLAKAAPPALAPALLLRQLAPVNTPANQKFFFNELQTSLLLFRQVSDRHLQGILLIHLAQTAFLLGKLDQMAQYLRNSRQYLDAPLWLGYWCMTMGWCYQAKGARLAAEEEFQQAIQHWSPTQLARIYLAQDDLSTALAYFEEALKLSAVLMTKSLALEAIAGIACCFAKASDLSRALELLYFVKNQPSTSAEVRHATDKLLVELAATVSPAVVNRAEQWAQSIKLADVTAALLQDKSYLATHPVELADLKREESLSHFPGQPATTQSVNWHKQSRHAGQDAMPYLPIAPTALLGRQQELQTLSQRIVEQQARLVTLLGPPGVGKTRLALAVARQLHPFFANGVVFVSLTAIRQPDLLANALCDGVGVKTSGHSLEAKARLIQHLRHQERLLVLDNFEQLLMAATANASAAEGAKGAPDSPSAVALLAELLAACPTLYLLVTSRERLHLRAEQCYRLSPLTLPAAVELFVQRAQALQPALTLSAQNRPAIETLCRQLDCLPLAIELVSVHSDQFSPKQLVTRLQERGLDLLNDGAQDLPIHQRTLRTAIESSYELLTDAEQQLFRALSVFVGGFDGEAVAALGFDEGLLHNLINKSLVSLATSEQDEPRYWLLETLHQYSHEQLLQQGEAKRYHKQHVEYFLVMAEKFSLYEPTSKLRYWFKRLRSDYENVRAALAWSVAKAEVELATRFIWPLNWFWDWRQDASSTVYWTRQVVALAQQHWSHLSANRTHPLTTVEQHQLDLLARVWYILACCTPDPAEEQRAIAQSLALNRLLTPNDLTPAIYHTRAFRENERGNFAYADELFAKALQSIQTIDLVAKPVRQNILGWTIKFQGKAAFGRGELQPAQRFLEQCIPLFAEIGQTFEVADTHLELQEVMLYLDEFEYAQKHYDLSLAGFREGFGEQFEQFEQVCAWHRGLAAIRQAHWAEAATLLIGRFQQLPIDEHIVLEYNELWRLMQVAANTEQYVLSATLLGAIAEKSRLDRWFLQPIYRPEYEAAHKLVERQLAATSFAAAYAHGSMMTGSALLEFVLANFQLERPSLLAFSKT